MRGYALRALAIVAIFGLTVSLCSAGTIRADRSDQSYLNLAANAKYAGVGRLDFSTASGAFMGSGTLVAPDWVLTAAHCVDGAKTMVFTVGGRQYTADRWVADPYWSGNLTAGYDLGLVHLGTSVGTIAPAIRYTGKSEAGQVGTFVGYGMTGTGLTGAIKFDGKKRAGQNVLDVLYGGSASTARLMLADFDNPNAALARRDNSYGSSKPLDLEYMIAPGDSGGGVFIDVAGKTFLAGVNSFGAAWDGKVDSDYGDIAGDTRVTMFNSWIDGVIRGSAAGAAYLRSITANGSYRPMDMELAPEPVTMALMLAGFALVRRRR